MTVHTKKFHLEERRRQVASLLAQSMTEQEIADKLGVGYLVKTLNMTFIQHIKKTLPSIKNNIGNLIQVSKLCIAIN